MFRKPRENELVFREAWNWDTDTVTGNVKKIFQVQLQGIAQLMDCDSCHLFPLVYVFSVLKHFSWRGVCVSFQKDEVVGSTLEYNLHPNKPSGALMCGIPAVGRLQLILEL